MSAPFEIVRAGYDRIGTSYRDRSAANPVRLTWVERLIDRLPHDSLVVDLGCGSGEPATRLLAQQHRVIGVDASGAQLALARVAVPSGLFVQADMARFSLRANSVDAVASFYATGHIPSHLHAELFSSVASWLRPGGVFLTSIPVSAGDETDPDWLGVPMYFGGIGLAACTSALAHAGFELERADTVVEDEGDGRTVPFHWLVAVKA